MARKRLTPLAAPSADAGNLETKAFGLAQTVTRQPPPIARVAGETAAEAALATLSDEVAQARAEGRLIVSLGLEEIDETHLVRDRIELDESEMAVLMTSLTERGQQTAIEVIDLGEDRAGQGPRYGLISGMRRLMALRRLHGSTGEVRFATIKALVRRPETASDAYRAMVDENEIRVGLSYWERARIAVQAAEEGVYPTVQLALRDLYSAASRAKRSKIGSFVSLYRALGDSLRFPTALPERLGLSLAKALEEDEGLADALRAGLPPAPQDASSEQAALTSILAARTKDMSRSETSATPRAAKTKPKAQSGVTLRRRSPTELVLSGQGADAALEAALKYWLANR